MKYPLPVVRENGVGRSENNHARVNRMNDENQRDIIVFTHPKEDMNTTRED